MRASRAAKAAAPWIGLRDFPLFFHYLNLKPETTEHELITDIYLPLK